jgi:hypothetical protein
MVQGKVWVRCGKKMNCVSAAKQPTLHNEMETRGGLLL